jgi:hypothetical protein
MEYSGKLTERFWMPKQIGVDDVLAHELRATAKADDRDLRDHIRFLLKLGLELRRLRAGQEHLSQTAHTYAQVRTSENNAHSREHTSAHRDSPGQLPLPGTVGPIPTRKRRIA